MANYSGYHDDVLIEGLRAGDSAAYTEIYKRYERLLYLFAFKRLGDREAVKDIVHEVFLSLWLNHADINIKYTLSTYLCSAVRNKIVDIIAHRQLSQRYVETFSFYKASAHNTTDHLIRHTQFAAIIEKEVKALPKKMQRVFDLSRENNLNRKEIAVELDISEQTVKSHMHHALKILKTRLGKMLFSLFL